MERLYYGTVKKEIFFKVSCGANKMAHQVKTLATKPDDLNLIPGTLMVERENQLPQIVFLPPQASTS